MNCDKLPSVLPGFQPTWTVRRGVQEVSRAAEGFDRRGVRRPAERLSRQPIGGVSNDAPGAIHFPLPMAGVLGPKVLLTNELAGSGGDYFPWAFHELKVGPLIGTRTWGGLVGIGGYPSLLDGGGVTAPRAAIYGLHGEWEVENRGIAPDIEVENDPASVAGGRDLQLEKAVQVTLEALKKAPVVIPDHPPYPNYHKSQ